MSLHPGTASYNPAGNSDIVINNDGNYHFVVPDIAAKIEQRDPKRIIVAHNQSEKEKTADDEFYAKFEIPDDLDW